MSDHPYFRFFFTDFAGDTLNLDAAETGAYVMLLGHLWATGSLPDDDDRLARIARMTPKQWARARPMIEPYFQSGWRNKRMDDERAWFKSKSESAKKRWGDSAADSAANFGNPVEDQGPPENSHAFRMMRNECIPESRKKKDKSSEAGASAAVAAPRESADKKGTNSVPAPIYTDSRHELFGEGVPILISLGLPDRRARSMIGTWLKQTRDDAQNVLGAIQRARDQRPADPIPWITAALKPGAKPNVDESRSCVAAARRLAEYFAGASSVDHSADQPVLRLIPKG